MIATCNPDDLYRYTRTAAALLGPDALNETHIADYHHDGFLAVENVLAPDEVAGAKQALDDLIHGRIPGYKDLQPEPEVKDRWATMTADERADSVRKVWQFVEHEARLSALTTHPVLQNILQRLVGEEVRLIQDMALLKPPFIGTEKPWHQDMAYFGWSPPEKIIGVWIALDPATAQNGCMHVLPGTHREGPVPHVHARDCQIPDARVQVERDVIVPLAPGGVLFFSALLHHGTPPNKSSERRWALQYHYAGESAMQITRTEHAALYQEDDRYAGCRGAGGTPLKELNE